MIGKVAPDIRGQDVAKQKPGKRKAGVTRKPVKPARADARKLAKANGPKRKQGKPKPAAHKSPKKKPANKGKAAKPKPKSAKGKTRQPRPRAIRRVRNPAKSKPAGKNKPTKSKKPTMRAPRVGRRDAKGAMQAVETFLKELYQAKTAGVAETSHYPALKALFDVVGDSLRPKVKCIINPRGVGAGIADAGLFTAETLEAANNVTLFTGVTPDRGAVEAKPVNQDADAIAAGEQVKKYLEAYGIVLVTNLREFLIVERDNNGNAHTRERFKLADNEKDFWELAKHPRAFTSAKGAEFFEFLQRACLQNVALRDPRDLAWFLASYARVALDCVERRADLEALAAVRKGLEDALGMQFTDEKGEHFFRSTLVQTIFYGVFSAWVLWHKENPGPGVFNWKTAIETLHVPFINTLYHQLSHPQRLKDLNLVEVLDWTAGVLNRVKRADFFANFTEDHAVQYFYEPFLAEFDPGLRKDLGVWYTPREIVKYQVARVDTVLREELNIADGLADPSVIVLDPCCGTGAYLVEVLEKIEHTLKQKYAAATVPTRLKEAAKSRVFGFELLPTPFVVSHLQLGLLLHNKQAPLSHDTNERVGVYLTNALTGWQPPARPKTFVFPELGEEHDAAATVKRDKRILVVIGNPPYNAFAGVSPEEEKGLVEPYKKDLNKPIEQGGWGIRKFNLDDLYVRFFRLAERRIAEMSGLGVVSFISNGSWVSKPSFVVLRNNLLQSFDKFWVENLHGNRKISEYAPDGRKSESVFAIRGFSPGIQQGVATSLWVKTGNQRQGPAEVRYRNDIDKARAEERRAQLLESLEAPNFNAAYTQAQPSRDNRFSFRPESVASHYREWPSLTQLCESAPSNGLMEKRGGSLIDVDRDALAARMRDYFDPNLSWDDYRERQTALTEPAAAFKPKEARKKAIDAEGFDENRLRRYALRPFDTQWCYYTGVSPVWNSARPALWRQLFEGNRFLICRPAGVASPEGFPFSFTRCLGDNHYQRGHSYYYPVRLAVQADAAAGMFAGNEQPRANLSPGARAYLAELGLPDPDTDARVASLVWMHALAIGYSGAYLSENADGIRRDWPRVPLPRDRALLEASAALGERVAALLDTEAEVSGVTTGTVEPLFRTVGAIKRRDGVAINPNGDDLALTSGWGHGGDGKPVMPGKGKAESRERTSAEREALAAQAERAGLTIKQAQALLGEVVLDVFLNGEVFWANVPETVWNYYIGGYQVVKKWLSYREKKVLGRNLTLAETDEVTNMIRRLTALVLLGPALDANYHACANAQQYAIAGPGQPAPAAGNEEE